jgi:hypothetical protein
LTRAQSRFVEYAKRYDSTTVKAMVNYLDRYLTVIQSADNIIDVFGSNENRSITPCVLYEIGKPIPWEMHSVSGFR